MSDIVTLTNAADTYNFRVGDPIRCAMGSDGRLYRLHGWRLACHSLNERLTRPFRKRSVVTAVDAEHGTVTFEADPAWWRVLR